MPSIKASPVNQVCHCTVGRLIMPPLAALTPGMMAAAMPMPITPPSMISSTDSTSTRVSTVPLVKPRVFNTASSGMRSRTACAMVLPVNSSRVKNTAAMIAVTIRPMSANCLAKDWLKACSVWLLVSWSEFCEIASMALATRVAWSTLSSFTMYQPTRLSVYWLASAKYSQWKTRLFSSPLRLSSATSKMPVSLSGHALLPSFFGKMVACNGMVSPTFQPWRLASAAPTMAPVRSFCQAFN